MDLTSLTIFRVVAQEESITRAAQKVGRVQSNVTTRIQQLEEELGVSLFQREGKRMLLTSEGEQLLSYADKLLSIHNEALQVIGASTPAGEIKIGSMEATVASRLSGPLAAFHKKWPEVNVSLKTGTTQSLMDAVIDHRLDCGLVALHDDDAKRIKPLLEGEPIWQEELMLLLPQDYIEGSPIGLATFSTGCTYRRVGEDWMREHGILRHINPILEMQSYHAIMACVAAGGCAAVMPKSVIDMYSTLRKTRMHSLVTIRTWLVWRPKFRTPTLNAWRAQLSATQAKNG